MMLRARVRPTPALKRRLGIQFGDKVADRVDKILDNEVAVDALARLLTEGMETVVSKDGRLDTKDLAAFLLKHLVKDGAS